VRAEALWWVVNENDDERERTWATLCRSTSRSMPILQNEAIIAPPPRLGHQNQALAVYHAHPLYPHPSAPSQSESLTVRPIRWWSCVLSWSGVWQPLASHPGWCICTAQAQVRGRVCPFYTPKIPEVNEHAMTKLWAIMSWFPQAGKAPDSPTTQCLCVCVWHIRHCPGQQAMLCIPKTAPSTLTRNMV